MILGLVYGYVPFMILPLYAFLDRIDRSLLEAARDLGASPFHAFRLVTLPLSVPAILAGCVIIALPMFGDYYTPDLLSGSPKTTLIGNQINLYVRGGQQHPDRRRARRRPDGVPVRADGVLRDRHARAAQRRVREPEPSPAPSTGTALARRPRFLLVFTLLYLVWSIVPILIAIRFSFNEGRSRSTAQGWSTPLVVGRPDRSVWHDPDLRSALFQSLQLAAIAVAVTVPLGVALAIGLTRWRGRAAGTVEVRLAHPARHAGDRDGRRAVPALRQPADDSSRSGRPPRRSGTSRSRSSFVLLIVRARLISIGPEYEEAAQDLGASRRSRSGWRSCRS